MAKTIAHVKKKPLWQLTPYPARSCWRKKHNGEAHYIGRGTTIYNEQDYKRAWTEWEALRDQLLAAEQQARMYEATAEAPGWKVSQENHEENTFAILRDTKIQGVQHLDVDLEGSGQLCYESCQEMFVLLCP